MLCRSQLAGYPVFQCRSELARECIAFAGFRQQAGSYGLLVGGLAPTPETLSQPNCIPQRIVSDLIYQIGTERIGYHIAGNGLQIFFLTDGAVMKTLLPECPWLPNTRLMEIVLRPLIRCISLEMVPVCSVISQCK